MKKKKGIGSVIVLSILFLFLAANYVAGGFGGGGGASSEPKVEITAEDVVNLEGDMSVKGNVGIGTATDGVPLHVSGPGWNIKMSDSSITSNWAILTNSGGTKYLRFYDVDNSADRLVIDSSGNVGIGTTLPMTKFHIEGTQATAFTGTARGILSLSAPYTAGYYTPIDFLYTSGANPTARIAAYHDGSGSKLIFGTSNNYASGITNLAMTIDRVGNVGIGTPDPQAKLYVIGNAFISDFLMVGSPSTPINKTKLTVVGRASSFGWDTSSDSRLKTNISGINGALDKVQNLEGVNFNWKQNGKQDVGFIAQDVEKVVPQVVSTDNDGYKSIDYGRLTAVLVEAMKEQQEQINELKAENEKLKQRVEALER